MKGVIFDIQHFSIQDGPGIRTTLFLKGCPLCCLWCHNPESLNPLPEIGFSENKCQACGICEKICPRNACSLCNPRRVDRQVCDVCGLCVEHCPFSALEIIGKEITVGELEEEVIKDEVFYSQSGGGVTISGGEPLHQFDFSFSLARSLKRLGYHLTIDTSGYGRGNNTDQQYLLNLIQIADLVLYDLKLIDDQKHRKFVGVSNQTILENALILGNNYPSKILFRYPLIPNINDSVRDFKKLNAFLARFSNCTIEILPYHSLGASKYQLVGKECVLENQTIPGEENLWLAKKSIVELPNVKLL